MRHRVLRAYFARQQGPLVVQRDNPDTLRFLAEAAKRFSYVGWGTVDALTCDQLGRKAFGQLYVAGLQLVDDGRLLPHGFFEGAARPAPEIGTIGGSVQL